MRKHLKKFINKPITVTMVSLIIAIIIGIYSYIIINPPTKYTFINAKSGSIINNTSHVSLGFLSSGRIKTLSVKTGDNVIKGQLLASLDDESSLGAITQAKAAYDIALANYQKVQNGATNATIDVANNGIKTAEQNLDHLIQNGYTQIDGLIRTNVDNLYSYPNSDNPEFRLNFFDQTTNSTVSIEPLDSSTRLDLKNSRLAIRTMLNGWSNTNNKDIDSQNLLQNLKTTQKYLNDISNTLNTLTYDSKYQSNIDKAKANISTARISINTMIDNLQNAQLAVKTAKSNANVVTTSARPEDLEAARAQVSNALGALQIAQSNYDNRVIKSPGDGVITSIRLSAGEVAAANATIIEISGNNFSKDVSIMLPKNAIIDRGDKKYVLVKTDVNSNKVSEKEVILGESDNENVEIVSGITIEDKIAIK